MVKNLLIVESPAKAKTIEKFLGKDFKVLSCFGHIRDLPKKNDAIDLEDNYAPRYEIPKDKKKLVQELKKIAKDAETIWLATDEDREGEAISWHLCEVLNLDPEKARRIVFHEITKDAILRAVNNPRKINHHLVHAQQARRVLDRLVGFELSPVLWKKISRGSQLSAGRVQSVAVRLIVEREEEIEQFDPQSYFKVRAAFDVPDENQKVAKLLGELPRNLNNFDEARSFLESCKAANYTISDIQVKPSKRSPAPPFTTSTLQQEASRKLGFSVQRTMVVAQKLYESGKITYMRTDSVNLSDLAIKSSASEISKLYGEKYSHPRSFKTKSSGAQEAHEAIRPSYLNEREIEGSADEERLYKLIWQRTIASQMARAEFERTTATIDISTNDEKFIAKGEVLKFDGFLKVYKESSDDEDEKEIEGILPPLQTGQELKVDEITATERFSRPPARYTEASLVRKLEELGIGRPSTYAPTISTIQKRGYVVKEDKDGVSRKYRILRMADDSIRDEAAEEMTGREKAKLFPTDMGVLVNGFLTDHFNQVMDYNFTANIEKQFDDIAVGGKEWSEMIDQFYKPFHKNIVKTMEEAERVSGERELGTDPKSGKPVIARMGKFGPMVQIGSPDDEEKPRYAKLMPGQHLQSISLEEALKLFSLPKKLGEYREDEVIVSQGKYGPYVRNKGKFYSLGKDLDPLEVTMEEAIEIIKKKDELDAKRFIKEFEEENIQVLNGRYGPYIKSGRKNYKIPKGKEPRELSLEECREIIEKGSKTKRKSRR